MMSATSSTWRTKLPDGSKSVRSVWVWRGFFFMSLMAIGLTISFAQSGLTVFAAAWGVIAAGWFATSMWLWRRHVRDDDLASQTTTKRSR
jgi:low temperature requirement protein LtrA